ncbi:unnamed protein product [Larinioides sclopetarius]|uniref:SWIM-type domain-containing protein n=1 Tax=Larinioides sclopetarius TaxID=280406 RepID=A0AAV2AU70_9ARAC
MGPAESAKYHSEILEMNPAIQPKDLTNSWINPTKRTVAYWHEQWRLLHLGPRNGQGMLEKSWSKRLFLEKIKKKALNSKSPINPEHVKKFQCAENQFSEISDNETYYVDVLSACCSCSAVRLGKFCKHQFAVYYYQNVCGKNFPAVGAKEKHEIATLALRQEAPSVAFYQLFRLNVSDVSSFDSCIDEIAPSTSQPFTADNHTQHDVQPDSNKEEKREKLIKAFRDTLEKFDPSGPVMEKALMRLKKISSEGQCETLLATLGNNVSLKKNSGVTIKVQPTSIARRAAGVTKGSKRLACGRPANGLQASKKRKHNLSQNIKMNQPNAKKH